MTGLASDGLLVIPANEPLLEDRITSLSQTVQTVGIQAGELSATILNESKRCDGFLCSLTMAIKSQYQEATMYKMH